jgi:hypothetical protein
MIDQGSNHETGRIGARLGDSRLSASHPIMDQWLRALNAHDVDHVCALYAEDAILLPTLSDVICDTPERIRKYFESFLSRSGLSAELSNCYVQEYSEVKIDSGIYQFSWQEGPDRKSARARFTFVIRDGRIVEHHSSLTPI